jgi:uncharacterized protein YcfL
VKVGVNRGNTSVSVYSGDVNQSNRDVRRTAGQHTSKNSRSRDNCANATGGRHLPAKSQVPIHVSSQLYWYIKAKVSADNLIQCEL